MPAQSTRVLCRTNRKVFKDREIVESEKVSLVVMKRTLKLETWRVESAKGKLPEEVIRSSVARGWCSTSETFP